ncbi:hypothetical protein ABZ845_27655 [Streptomyces sp. NPDC047022]|uniref:hypothetical protein n=1 Tax=Streptomyces sp. NPDC047022 TaxID=3155737 RepID=UPI0033C63AE8
MGRRRVRVGVAAVAGVLFAGASAVPAHAVTPVACNTAALITAINNSNAGTGDTLSLTSYCVYTLTDADGQLPTITQPLVIQGNHATIRRDPNAGTQFRIFEVASGGSLTMDTLTVMNGFAPSGQDGGGVLLSGTMTGLTTTDVNFQGNRAQNGGGLAVEGSTNTVSITGGLINDNGAAQTMPLGGGGGIYGESNNPITLNSVTLSGNRSGFGGAISLNNFTQSLTLNKCAVRDNTGLRYGGAIGNAGGASTITITDSSITDNQVPRSKNGGGAIAAQNTTLNVTGSTISGNTLSGFTTNASGAAVGGGVVVESAVTTLDSTQVTGNRIIGAGGQGAGIAASGGTLTLQNGTSVTGNLTSGRYSQGGGLYINNILGPTTVAVDDSHIDRNRITGTGSVAGGIFNTGGTFSFSNASSVNNNTAPPAPAPGGVYTDVAINAVDAGTTFTGNAPTNCLLSPAPVTGCVG